MRLLGDSVVGCLGIAVLCLVASVETSAREKTAAELAAEDRAIDALAGRQNAIADKLTGYPGERHRVRHDRHVEATVDDSVIPLPVGGITMLAPERRAPRETPPSEPAQAPVQAPATGEAYAWPVYVPYAIGGAPSQAPPPVQPISYQAIPSQTAPAQPTAAQPTPAQAATPVEPVPYQTVPYQTAPPVEPVPYQTVPPVEPVPYVTLPVPPAQQGY